MNASHNAEQSPVRNTQILYGAIVLLSSAIVMVLEIAAGRLIAPYVGASLYSWTSIIGVVLAGLSLGNWAGGRWADAGARAKQVGLALALSAVATLGIVFLLTLIAPLVQARPLGLMSASFLLATGLFFLPAACLGLVAPMLTTLALDLDERSGHVVGRMHALAALGSILGTFLTGFVLIQYLGTRTVIVAAGLMLLLLALPLLRGSRTAAAMLAVVVLGAAFWRQGFTEPCDVESQYFCIRVVDSGGEGMPAGSRTLVLDHLVHGISYGPDPTLLFAPYSHLMDELVRRHLGARTASARYFFAGGGAFSQPRAVKAAFPRATVEVAELDPAVTAVAARQLFLEPKSMTIVHTDARVALAKADAGAYDAIVGDVFHDVAVPFHLTTLEYAELVASRLAPGGIYVMNVVDVFPDPRLVKSVVRVLAKNFRQVDVWLNRIPADRSRATYVISAADAPQPPPVIEARNGLARQWLRVTASVLDTGTPVAFLPLLSDDFVPVERLVSPLLLETVGNR
ncbi:MAG: fused MFS/spermidine synthase [Gammaproteobacteria bacterium]|nr:fused MFS/spermidine synthase [Gammaproteobacteria bacterium]